MLRYRTLHCLPRTLHCSPRTLLSLPRTFHCLPRTLYCPCSSHLSSPSPSCHHHLLYLSFLSFHFFFWFLYRPFLTFISRCPLLLSSQHFTWPHLYPTSLYSTSLYSTSLYSTLPSINTNIRLPGCRRHQESHGGGYLRPWSQWDDRRGRWRTHRPHTICWLCQVSLSPSHSFTLSLFHSFTLYYVPSWIFFFS